MTPSVDERLASIVRALTDVVLPALPSEAGLAKEQVQLALGHIQILRAQIDAIPAFEAEELADAMALAERLIAIRGADGAALDGALNAARTARTPAAIRAARIAINASIHDVIVSAPANPAVEQAVLLAETARTEKDRAWFAPFGFDPAPPSPRT